MTGSVLALPHLDVADISLQEATITTMTAVAVLVATALAGMTIAVVRRLRATIRTPASVTAERPPAPVVLQTTMSRRVPATPMMAMKRGLLLRVEVMRLTRTRTDMEDLMTDLRRRGDPEAPHVVDTRVAMSAVLIGDYFRSFRSLS